MSIEFNPTEYNTICCSFPQYNFVCCRGCGAESDTVCGTIVEFRQQLHNVGRGGGAKGRRGNGGPVVRRRPAKKPKDVGDSDDGYVYGHPVTGKGRTATAGGGKRRKGGRGATATIRETVNNASQKKHEFIEKLLQEENIKVDLDAGEDVEAEDVSNEAGDTVTGQVKYGEYSQEYYDENYEDGSSLGSLNGKTTARDDDHNLHTELRIINDELMKEKGTTEAPSTTTATTTTPVDPVWKHWTVVDYTRTTSTAEPMPVSTTEDYIYNHPKMYYDDLSRDGGSDAYGSDPYGGGSDSYDGEGVAVVNEDPNAYGEIHQAPKSGKITSFAVDEFDLLKNLIERNKT